MNGLKRLNEALPGLVIGIIVYGLIIQFTGVWFVEDKIRYSSGLWIGIACAIGMAVHLAIVIEEAVRFNDGNTKRLSVKSVLRYAVVVVVIFLMMYFNLGNLVTAFLGILGLKVSAYVQPFMHKVIFKDLEPDESQEEVEEEVKL
ncbi:MAG: hypothetical protein K6B67_04495 [Lachnospiraceae bacterium]|nr:hypothetical protein [Lachnospiraceae bacterium]